MSVDAFPIANNDNLMIDDDLPVNMNWRLYANSFGYLVNICLRCSMVGCLQATPIFVNDSERIPLKCDLLQFREIANEGILLSVVLTANIINKL